ncbi:MAG: GAF domain-containing protein [Myxococcales bacterium]|nr:GAF domain-containing protein [Myxococcales bacterium]
MQSTAEGPLPERAPDPYRDLLHQLDDGFCLVDVLFDETGETAVDYRFVEHNEAFVRHTGLQGALGKTARELVPELDELWFRIYGRVARTGKMERFERPANAMGRVFEVQAMRVGLPEDRRVAILFRDITSLRRAQADIRESMSGLEQSEARLRLITDDLPVLVSLIDDQFRYRFVNAGYERWFGVTKEEILGRSMEEVLGEAAFAVVRPHAERALAGTEVSYEAVAPYRLGGTRWIQAIYRPRRAPDGHIEGIVALVVDITERKALEEFRAHATAQTERLLRVTSAIAAAVSSAEVYAAIVDRVAEALGASKALLWSIEGDELRLAHSHGYAEEIVEAWKRVSLQDSQSLPVVDAVNRGEPLWFGSTAELAARYPAASLHFEPGPSRRYALLPLATPRQPLGALVLAMQSSEEPPEKERELLLLVARYASQALERLRLFSAERSARHQADAAASRLALLSRTSHAISAAELDLAARVQAIVTDISQAFESWVAVFLLKQDGLLHFEAAHHPIPEMRDAAAQRREPFPPLQLGEGLVGTVAATGESVLVNGIDPALIAARAAAPYRELLERLSPSAAISAPLRARGRVIGVLSVGRVRRGDSFTEEDRLVVEELAERAAVGIENSQLYEESRDARARAELLHRFGQLVAASERIETIFTAALDALQAIAFDRAAILTIDDDSILRLRAARGLEEGEQRALERRAPWQDGAEPLEPVPAGGMNSGDILLPLATRGRVSGALLVGTTEPLSSPHLGTARAIANYLSSVVARFGALAELQETLRYNELFAGILAHDLRNPVNAIMMAAQLLLMRLEGQTGDRTDARPVSKILASGQRMAKMVDQLLDFTRARSGGGIAVHPVPTNLANLCAQAVEELALVNPDWRLQREVVGDPNGVWDPDRLLQVISNLAGNAGQHGSARGPITVRIDGSDPGTVELCVHNEGAIPPEIVSHLFDPFHSARRVRERSQGLGLGLFIVREIVRAHTGTVTVSSTEPEGTAFTVRLPRTSPPTKRAPSG